MRTQISVQAAAGSVQRLDGIGHRFTSRADRVEGRRARITPPICLEPDGDRWMVRVSRLLTLSGDTPEEVRALADVVLGHTPTGCASAQVTR